MEARKVRRADRALRPAMRSPGRPPVGRREHRERFWEGIGGGLSSEDAGVAAGVSPVVGSRWFRENGGMVPFSFVPVSGRYLSFVEREEIAVLHARVEFPRFSGHVFCDRVRGFRVSREMEVLMPAAYPEEFRRRAVDLVRTSDESVSAVARRLGISGSGLRRWVAQAEIDEGRAPGLSTEEREELTRLRRENRVLRMERDLLSRAAAFFAQENVLPK